MVLSKGIYGCPTTQTIIRKSIRNIIQNYFEKYRVPHIIKIFFIGDSKYILCFRYYRPNIGEWLLYFLRKRRFYIFYMIR